MASTDFLLQSSTPSKRVQPAMQDKVANQRSTAPTPAQSFSSVYAQQRSTHANQQQAQQAKQRDAVAEQNQQQAARHTASKPAAQPTKDQAVTAHKESAASKAPEPEPHDSAATTVAKQPAAVAEPAAENKKDALDPLLLMAMIVMPTDYAMEVESELEAGGVLGDTAVGLGLADMDELSAVLDESAVEYSETLQEFAAVDAESNTLIALPGATTQVSLEGEQALSDEDELQLKADVTHTSASKSAKEELAGQSENSALLGTASAKSFDAFIEKSHADKNSSEALTETLKAAPETLLNNKAVTPTDTIRADLQPRAEPLLTAQSVRQVPGAAIAIHQPGWTQEVTDKVMWMSAQNLRSAEIKLDPAELGRLDIKVDMTQEHTQISFSSAHAGVRESLESQMYRLREMLTQQGMQNVDVNVSDQSQREQSESQAQTAAQGRSGTGTNNTEDTQQHVTSIREPHDGRLGLVDYYA